MHTLTASSHEYDAHGPLSYFIDHPPIFCFFLPTAHWRAAAMQCNA
jgi:hypothetical protein